MTTIPARLAQTTRTSSSPQEARRRVVELYRLWYRSAPEICTLYALDVSPTYVRRAIRAQFEQNRHVSDPKVIDVLLLKGRQEYQETVNCWKMPDQLLGILLNPRARTQKTFMQKFLEGRDEEAALPAATGIH
ncbi:hypothetical protein PUNSTDRAFT_128041 [Punctularia strigosozonata HHB-11173 SS5]|uniref:Complex 1 LYR protein domain-containing protein n=1 Tax=Punctularia strigosozonata (strain HHB-11173) TaxID=741275 RepID=R7S5L2_PUNST|nr:uncharacterized protein PUNSTDRAFT_128041 [Punctularia strigosozonata HHB-11173 SS5]EIN05267.1 hypothetical protein PUNSTDRAFT_128041 [Punctularia strigosozonata HHB-11173 SS5]